eukprot:TRINITY_DN6867_c0_g2_i1.p1 TRINITY_DN6867_c0_g2~~TRINITY_DN6867_c0_g2_i1.p1  ORF type:complete len:234 (-),score=46.28 TRINITY_DN6867_c0_g2_i1:424-1125(-)
MEKHVEQEILDLLWETYEDIYSQEDFGTKLQKIKEHFVKRDYLEVFQADYLPVYLANYVPSRALTYHELFVSESFLLDLLFKPHLNICCLGGGPGSELLSIASVAREFASRSMTITMNVHDLVTWDETVQPLLLSLLEKWNVGPDVVKYNTFTTDILVPTTELLEHLKEAELVTLMFTVNELFQQKNKALSFMSQVRDNMKKGLPTTPLYPSSIPLDPLFWKYIFFSEIKLIW